MLKHFAILATLTGFAIAGQPVDVPPANVYSIETVRAWALDAQSLAAQQVEAKRATTNTASSRSLAVSSADVPYAGTDQPIFATTPDGFPIRWRLSADAVRFVLAQPGVVRVELLPIYDAQKNRSSVAVVGLKADGSSAPLAADGANGCPPFCAGDDPIPPTVPPPVK